MGMETPTRNPASGKPLPAPTGTAADVGTAAMVFVHDMTGRHVATGRAYRSTPYGSRGFSLIEGGEVQAVPPTALAARHPSGVWTVYLEG